MRRYLLIIAGVVVLAWAVAAIASGSATLGIGGGNGAGAQTAARSPACDLSGTERSARLAGTSVFASPAPGSATAAPATQISFLGASAAAITGVSVDGSASGHHTGRLSSYSQGDGASFVPSQPFHSGEHVTVAASIGGRAVSFTFTVDTPYSTAEVAPFTVQPAGPADTQSFVSLPGVKAPVMTVTTPDRDPAAGDVFLTNGPGPGRYGPLIYRPDGRLVWFEQLTGEETAENLSVQSYEGRQALTWWKGRVLSLGFGLGEDIVMNNRYQEIARVAAGNGLKADLHDFQLAAGDVAYISAYNPIRCDLHSVGGKSDGTITDVAVQAIDVHTGLVRWEWHALDHVSPSESEVEVSTSSYPWDYFHLDSIDPQPDGRLLLSARSTWAGYEVEGGSGKILWRLGGTRSTFKMGAGTKMAWQHDGRMRADGTVTFFDDGSNPPIHSQSRGLVIALDPAARTARLVRSYVHTNPAVLAASQGNMQTLTGDSVLLGYGGVPQLTQFSSGGSVLFDAHQPYDMTFYRAYRFPWSAQPASAPAVAASLNNTEEETIVHASWNGATGVASWRVLAGETPQALAAVATIPSAGFETGTTLPKKYKYVEVQALDGAGAELAGSSAVAVVSFPAAQHAAQGGPGA